MTAVSKATADGYATEAQAADDEYTHMQTPGRSKRCMSGCQGATHGCTALIDEAGTTGSHAAAPCTRAGDGCPAMQCGGLVAGSQLSCNLRNKQGHATCRQGQPTCLAAFGCAACARRGPAWRAQPPARRAACRHRRLPAWPALRQCVGNCGRSCARRHTPHVRQGEARLQACTAMPSADADLT